MELHNLEMYKNIDMDTMLKKLAEEAMEVAIAVKHNDIENLEEELLDVMQVCKGIAYVKNICLDKGIEKHNNKLLSRGHKFID